MDGEGPLPYNMHYFLFCVDIIIPPQQHFFSVCLTQSAILGPPFCLFGMVSREKRVISADVIVPKKQLYAMVVKCGEHLIDTIVKHKILSGKRWNAYHVKNSI